MPSRREEPAFPREWYASVALAGLLAGGQSMRNDSALAQQAFALADAMLAASERTQE